MSDFEELNDRLNATGNRLSEAHAAGDEKASRVLDYWFTFVLKCPTDQFGIALCMNALDEWEESER
jgi:hypothetical protein